MARRRDGPAAPEVWPDRLNSGGRSAAAVRTRYKHRMRYGPLIVGVALLLAGCAVEPNAPQSAAPATPSAPATPAASAAATASIAATPSAASVAPSASEPAELDGVVAYVGGADPQIHLLDLASGQSRQLTNLRPEDAELTASGPMRPVLTCGFGPTGLQWAPDGSRLAFAYGGCDKVVHVVDLDGTLQRIGGGRSPAWSPDGRRLVYEQNYPFMGMSADRAWPLLVVDMDGGDLTPRPLGEVGMGFFAGSPSYSPDGALLTFTGPLEPGSYDPMSSGAYVMRSDGADLMLAAPGAWSVGWLPDGRIIVNEPTMGGSSAVDPGSGDSTPVAGGDSVHAISPDGSLLLAMHVGDEGQGVRLYRVGGELVAEMGGFAPTWSPDGRALLVNDTDSGELLVIGVDGTELGRYELTTPVGGDQRARWQPAVP